MDKNFRAYTWYSLDCVGHISLQQGVEYTVDILGKSYSPTKDCFFYKRIRNVAMSKKWHKSGDHFHLSHKGDELPLDVRPLAFMLIENLEDNTVCPTIFSVEDWKAKRKSKEGSVTRKPTCLIYDTDHHYDDKGMCACGADVRHSAEEG